MEASPIREYTVDLTRMDVHEAGAMLLALLAYPEHGSSADESRGALHASLCALALHRRRQRDPTWAAEPQSIRPVYACRHPGAIAKDCRTLLRRLRDRLAAGWMLLGFLREALGHGPVSASRGDRPVSLSGLSAAMADEGIGLNDPDSVETRVWRPSLPVVHLAAAMGIVAQNGLQNQLGGSLPEALLGNRWVIESVVRVGEDITSLIPRAPRLPLSPGQLIRVRLA
jgi:hypothetical protein